MKSMPQSIGAIDYGNRLRAGVLIPSGNSVAEPELRAMLPSGCSMLVTRLRLRGSSKTELTQMIDRLEAASELLADACVDVIVFHCTAVSTFAPDLAGGIRERIERASGIRCFTTADAILAVLSKLNAKRISLLTPYIDEVHAREIAWLEANGVHVESGVNLGINTNADMARLEPWEILSWARDNVGDAADACFLSCTAIKSAAIIAPLERVCGRPVLTSNQNMVWHLLRSSNILDSVEGFGQLLESPEREAVSP
jgi:maleate isomerase